MKHIRRFNEMMSSYEDELIEKLLSMYNRSKIKRNSWRDFHTFYINGGELDYIQFSAKEPGKVLVRYISGHHLSKLAQRIGFHMTDSGYAGVDGLIPGRNWEPKEFTTDEFIEIIYDIKNSFSVYAKSFKDFYRDREPD